MSRHPLSVALERLDEDPSAEFRGALRARLLADFVAPTTAIMSGAPVGAETDSDGRVELVDDPPQITVVAFRETRPRARLLGIAAAVVVIAGVTATVLSRGPESAHTDASRDSAVAKAALLTPDMVDRRWDGVTHRFDAYTSRVAADLAATVPECAPYVDYAFDSPKRDAATAGRVLTDETSGYLFQWVSVFPTEDAASRAMDKIAERAFLACFNKYSEASFQVLAPGYTSVMSTIEAPRVALHGVRQVVFDTYATSGLDPGPGAPLSVESVNVFVQVGRAIVYVNPVRDFHDGLDPRGPVEIAVTVAVNALASALESRPPG